MARLSLGVNVVVEEDENGDAVITNTADGTSISLESFISIVGGGLGDAANPVPGTSYFETADADSIHTEEARIERDTDITVNVPSDYSTWQAAIDDLRKEVIKADLEIVLNLESGHTISDGLQAYNGDFSHIRITSDDATVPVDAGAGGSIIDAKRAWGPILDTIIDAQGNGNHGYEAREGATGYVYGGAGVRNASLSGILCRQNSTVLATDTIGGSGAVDFTGAGTYGAYTSHGSRSYIRAGDFSGAGTHCIRARGATIVDAENAVATGATEDGVSAEDGATIYAEGIDASNAGDKAINVDQATVHAQFATLTGAGNVNGRAAGADSGGLLQIRDADAGTLDISVGRGATVVVHGATYGSTSETINTLTSNGIIFG